MAALLAGAGSAAAQDAAPQIDRYWGAWGELGAQAGSESAAFLEGFMPVGQDGDSLVFLDLRLDYGENARGSMSVGFGIRELVADDLVLGANAFVDVVRTENSKYHLGATLGLEAFTSIFDLRLNAHIPLGGATELASRTVATGVDIVNNQLVEQRALVERKEALLYGLTGEIGALFDSPFARDQQFRTYVGGYVYDRGGYKMETGARLGVEYRINDALGLSGSRLTLGAELVYDKHDKLDAIASARFRMPLYAGRVEAGDDRASRLTPIRERMGEGVRRDKGIRAGTRTRSSAQAAIPVVNPTTGRSYGGIYYADSTGGGTGGFLDPTSLSAALASAGADGIVVVLGDNGTVTTSGVTLQSGQVLVGGGQSVAVRLSSGLTTNFLTSGTAGTIDGDPGVTTVTLADNVLIQGLTLQGGTTVIAGNNVANVRLSNLAIENAVDGVRITGATGASLSNLTFSGITGTSVFLNNQSATLSNITIDGGTNGVSIANNSGTTSLSTINISNVTGDALSFANNGGVINVSNLTATNTGNDGVVITGGGSFAFTGTTVIDGLGAGTTSDGFDLTGTTGATISTGAVAITGLGSGTGLNLAGGDATVTMASLDVTGTDAAGSRGIDISGTQNGRTVTITNGGTISGVDTGIVLGSNGAAGAAPSANFTFGGGSVSGNTYALDGIGVVAGNGSYAFGSTAFTGGFNFAVSLSNNYYVAATATGTGDGSSADNRASIATAIAQASSLGAVNFILINDGSAIDTAGLTFTLDDGQTIDTFGEGRSFTEAGLVIPVNITGANLPAGGIAITDPTGLGAATLTNSSGAVATLSLANGNAIRNILIGSSAGNAISGSGIAGLSLTGVTATAGIDLANTTGAVTLTNLAISNTTGTALSLSGAGGTVTGSNVDIAGGSALAVSGGDATISFDADSSIVNGSGTAVAITGRIGGSFSHFGAISSNGGTASGITISGATGTSNVTFGGQVSLGTTTALGGGVTLDNAGTASTIAFTGGLDIVTSGAAALTASGGGTLNITGGTLSATGGAAATVGGVATDITLSSLASSGAAGDALSLALGAGSSFTVTGATTLSGMGSNGIDLSGSTGGSFSFGDVDVTGLGSGTGLNLAGGDATVTMASLDVTGTDAAGSRGIDISGTQNGRTVTITNGGTISGVDTGIVLGSNGAAGAAPSANFTFGGGSVSGNTYALDGIGVVAGNGSYAFGSTAFTGGFNFAVSLSNNYYVAATATGTGDGSSADNRASIATAIAQASSLGAVNFILINDGSAIDTAGLTFTLDDGQTIDTFGEGRSFTEAGLVIPVNITGANLPAGGIAITDPTGLGAATLTNSSGAVATLSLANGNAIRNILIGSSAGNAISGSGIAGLSLTGVTATAGIDLANTTGAVTLTNLAISNTTGTALSLSGAGGTVTGSNVDIAGGSALAVSGGDATISFDADSSIVNGSGTAVAITGRIGGSFSHFGAISSNGGTASGITISGATGTSNVTFGGQVSLGTTTALGGGVTLDNAGTASTIAFTGGLDIVTSGAAALTASGGGTLNITGGTLSATGGAALNLAGMAVDVTLDQVNATNSNMSSVVLQNLDGSFSVNGGVLSTVASGTSFNSFDVIQNDSGATRSLTLSVDNLTITHDASGATLTPTEHGLVVTTSGDDSAIVSISNSTFRTEDSGVRVIANNGLATVTNFANNTLLGDATSFDPAVFGNGVMFQGVTFDADPFTAGIQAVNGGTFTAGTPGQAVVHGIFFDNTAGANSGRIDFSNYTVNAITTGLSLGSGNPGLTVGIADGDISAGTVRLGSGSGVANGDITLSSLTLSSGLSANQYAGSFSVTGATTITAPETFLDLGGGNFLRTTTTAVSVASSSAAFSFDTLTIGTSGASNVSTGGATVGIYLSSNSGTFTVGGTTTISNTAEDAIRITSTSGAISFGQTVISNPFAAFIPAGSPLNAREARSAAVDISGTIDGNISFASLDIALNSGDSTGLEMTGATLNAAVTAGDFDVTGNGSAGTIAVDLRGALGGGTVQLGDTVAGGSSSSIAGVHTGVFLDNTTNLAFTFGDGEDTTDTGSSISATVAIDAGSAPVAGTYNFRDIAFQTSPGNGFGLGRVYFVDADGAVGGGDGSGSDASNPMTLAAAEAAIAAGDIIVLIDNGMAISTAGSNLNDTLNLLDNVQLLSFGDGAGGSQALAVNITAPPTILLSAAGLTIADPTGNGAATLTTTAGNDVITLASTGNRISGVILEGGGTTTTGIRTSGTSTGLTVDQSIIRNFSGFGISIGTSVGTAISNSSFSGNAGDITLGSASGTTLSNLVSTGATGTSLSLSGTSGTTALSNLSITTASGGRGLLFTNAGGTVTGTNVDISGGSAIRIFGGNAAYSFDAGSTWDLTGATSGTSVELQDLAGGSFAHAGSVSASGTGVAGLTASGASGAHSVSFTGTVDFGTTSNRVSVGILINNNGQAADYTFADLDVASFGGLALSVQNGGTIGIGGGTLSSLDSETVSLANTGIGAGGITLTSIDSSDVGAAPAIGLDTVSGGAFTVTGTTAISGTLGAGIQITGTSSAVGFGTTNIATSSGFGLLLDGNSGTLGFGDTTIAMSGSSGRAIRATGANGAITFGDVDITGVGASGTGLDLSGGTFDGQITFATLDITGTGAAGSRGINLTGYTNSQNVVTTGASTIQNVQFGVDLTNADIADGVRFQFGDGSAPVASTIDTSAVGGNVAIVTTGLTATGEYNFEDVDFGTSNVANLQGVSYYVVGTDGSVGPGAGSFLTPGTIAGAEASGASAIILVDNSRTGGDDGTSNLIDAVVQGDGTLNLAGGQVLIAMIGGETFDLATLGLSAGGAPASLRLTGINTGTSVTASDPAIDSVRPILTTSGANNTVELAGNATLQNVIIANAGSGAGILASYGAGSDAVIRSSTIGGGTGAYAFDVTTTAGSSTVLLDGVTLNGGLRLDGTAGGSLAFSTSGSNTITSSQTAALTLATVVAGGNIGFDQITSTGDAAGMRLDGVSGTGSITIQNAAFTRSGTATADVVALADLTTSGALTIANLDIGSTSTQTFVGLGTSGTTTTTLNIGTGANGVVINNTGLGMVFTGSHGTVNVGTAGTGLQIASRGTAVTFASDSTGTFALGHAGATSALTATPAAGPAFGIAYAGSDAVVTATNIDINGTGSDAGAHGIFIQDDDGVGSFTLTGTNTIDATGGDGVFIQNANATISGLTLGASSQISGGGIRIANSNAIANTVSLSDITMGSGGNGDTGDIAGSGLVVSSAGAGTLTVNLTGTNVIRSTGTALQVAETGAGTANNLLLSIDNTTFETGSSAATVSVIGQNVSTTASSIGIRSFANNTVIGNGTGGGIRFEKVDFDSDGAGAAVAAGTLNVGQGTGNRVAGNGLSLIDTTGELGFTTLNIFNDGGTGLEVDTKTNGFNTVFTLNGGGSGTVDTTNGTALFLDPLTMNLTFGTVNSTNASGSGVYVEGGNATAAGNNALTIGTLNVTNSTNAGLLITNSVGTFSIGATVINNAGTAGGGVDIDVTNGDTLNLTFTGDLAITTSSGTGLDVQSSGGSTVTLRTAAAATTSITTDTGRLINAENLLAGVGGINFDTLTASGTVAGHAISLDLDAGAFSGGTLSVAGTTGGHGVLLGGTGGTVAFDSATIANVANSFFGVSSTHAGTVTFTTVGISGSQNGIYTYGDGAVSVNGGTVNVAGGRGVWINGGGGAISIAAAITQSGVGEAVYVVSRTGSTAALSGDITFTGSGATGINVESNTGGTITFSGLGTLATGANTAVRLLNNTGATVNFTGALDIDTTSGAGFSASGGGTITVSNSANTIDTATGQAILIDGMTIGASGVAFNTVTQTGTSTSDVIQLTSVGGAGTFSVAASSINRTTGSGLRVFGSSAAVSLGTFDLGSASNADNAAYGIHLNDNSGSFTVTGNVNIINPTLRGVNITDAQASFIANFQGQTEVRNSTNASATVGAGFVLLGNHSSSSVTFANLVYNDEQRGAGAAGGRALVSNGGTLAIATGSLVTNNALGNDTYAVDISGTTGGAGGINFGNVTIDHDDSGESGGGLRLIDNTGSFTFGSINRIATNNGAGILASNTGTLNIGTTSAGSIEANNRAALDISSTTLNLTATNVSSTNSTGTGMAFNTVGGTVNLTGNITLTGSASTGLSIANSAANAAFTFSGSNNTISSGAQTGFSLSGNNATSTVSFTTGTLAIATTSGVAIQGAGTNGTVSFNDVDVTGLTSGTGLRLTSTYRGAMTFNTLDITGTGGVGSKGIDLAGYANNADVVIANPSAIHNVQTGIDLTNANIADGVRFQYGDGSAPVASTIDTTGFAVVTTGMAATGTFDLEDVAFGSILGTTDISNLQGGASYFVVGSSQTSGAGTFADPGTLAEALASGQDIIVLIDETANTTQDTINLGSGSLTLPDGRGLISLANGQSVDVTTLGFAGGGGAPANLLLTGISGGSAVITATGGTIDSVRPILTSSNATATVLLGGSAAFYQVEIVNTGAAGAQPAAAIRGVFAAGSHTLRLQNSTLRGNGTGTQVVLDINATGGEVAFNVTGNTFHRSNNGGYLSRFQTSSGGSLQGTISGNTMSSSATVNAIYIGVASGNNALTIQNNTITLSNGAGIAAQLDGSTARLDLAILGNTISANSGNSVQVENLGSGSATVCVNIANNTFTTTPSDYFDIVIANTATFHVQGLGATDATAPDFDPNSQPVETYLSGQQTSAPSGTIVNPYTSTQPFTAGTCNLPTGP